MAVNQLSAVEYKQNQEPYYCPMIQLLESGSIVYLTPTVKSTVDSEIWVSSLTVPCLSTAIVKY